MTAPEKIRIEAKPNAITLLPDRTAIVVVDMQNDFGAPGGMFDLAGIDIAPIRKVIAPTAAVLAAARRAGICVVYLKMGFQPDLSDAGAVDGPNRIKHEKLRLGAAVTAPNGRSGRILIRDTWNTEIVPELTPEASDVVLYKSRYSGFYNTSLDEVLRQRGIQQLVFTGCTTSVCVESTLRDAMFRDYICLLLEDCTAEPGLAGINHDASLLAIQGQFGWVAQSESFVAALQRLPASALA